jgi:hypothetical protein
MESIEDVDFKFELRKEPPFTTFQDRDVQSLFEKWGMNACMYAHRFSFDEIFLRGHVRRFLMCFFSSSEVRASLQFSTSKGTLAPISKNTAITDVVFTPLTCTATSLDMFDVIKTKYPGEIVREESSHVIRMADIYLPAGVTVADRLRETFMCGDDAPHPDVFSPLDKKEFLYHVMWRLVAGGSMNQYEDDLQVYLNTARDVYKDLVQVRRAHDGEVETATEVFQVTGLVGAELFGRKDDNGNHNFCYVCISPAKREVCLWYGGFYSMF